MDKQRELIEWVAARLRDGDGVGGGCAGWRAELRITEEAANHSVPRDHYVVVVTPTDGTMFEELRGQVAKLIATWARENHEVSHYEIRMGALARTAGAA